MMNRLFVVFVALIMTGCPKESCEKVMVCEDQTESDCYNGDDNCESCNYYVTEWCWEECKGDVAE